jgi:hypothetical protein
MKALTKRGWSINRGPLAMDLLTGKFSTETTLPIDDVRGRHSPEWMGYFKNGQPNPLWLEKLEGSSSRPEGRNGASTRSGILPSRTSSPLRR